MPFDASTLTQDQVTAIANKLANQIRNFRARLDVISVQVTADNYTALLQNVNAIRTFNDYVQQVINAGLTAQVVAKIIDIFGNANVTQADIAGFRNALVAIRTYVVSNIASFPASYDAVDNIVFVTSPGATIKSGVQTRIAAALAYVSSDQ